MHLTCTIPDSQDAQNISSGLAKLTLVLINLYTSTVKGVLLEFLFPLLFGTNWEFTVKKMLCFIELRGKGFGYCYETTRLVVLFLVISKVTRSLSQPLCHFDFIFSVAYLNSR